MRYLLLALSVSALLLAVLLGFATGVNAKILAATLAICGAALLSGAGVCMEMQKIERQRYQDEKDKRRHGQ